MTTAEPRITIALLDDHPAIIMAIKPLLSSAQFEVVGTFQTAADFRLGMDGYRQRTGKAVQVALVDYQLGPDEPDGTALIKSLARRYADTRFIVHSAVTEDVMKSLAIANGARGFIGKTVPLERIPQHVLAVLRNKTVIDPPPKQGAIHADGRGESYGLDKLTAIELDVARLLLGDLTNLEIAAKLGKAPSTISTQAGSIYEKLGVKHRTAFVGAKEQWLERLDRIHVAPRATRDDDKGND